MNLIISVFEFRLLRNHLIFAFPFLKKPQNNFIQFKSVKCFNSNNHDKDSDTNNQNQNNKENLKNEENLEEIDITFVSQENEEQIVKAKVGDSILKVAHDNNINIEGACDGFCACSTCHVIIDEKFYDLIPEPSDNEIDMLEMAPCITETSRLGCQIKLEKKLSGMKVKLPPMTRNFYVDGHVPSPH